MKIQNKYKLILSLLGILSLGLSSCSDWLDINSDPYSANDNANIDPGYLFNYAATTHSSNRQGGDFYIPLLISGQTVADGGFVDLGGWWNESMYDISVYSTGNTWVTAYANVGTNLSKANMFAEKSDNYNAIAQSMILQAQVFFEMTMIFGDVPFSEALNIDEYKTPAFDSQEDVLNGILEMLDDALDTMEIDEMGITDYDIFYKGDMVKWAQLARSIKLKVLMVMVDKDPSKSVAIKDLVEDGGFIDEDSEWEFPFYEEAGTQNPNYRINDRYGAAPDYYMFFAHNSVLDLMTPLDDPRLSVYFTKGVDGDYHGLLTSQDVEDVEGVYLTSAIDYEKVWTATAPDILYSYSELQFILAEIYARGIGVSSDLSIANEKYMAGVEAALKHWNISDSELDAYKAKLSDLSTLSSDMALQSIYSQVWIDFMLRPFEAWVQSRRTLFPALSVPEQAPYENLISRWVYPDRERNVNPNVPSPLPLITDKMWFQK